MPRHARIPHSIVWQFNTESLKGKQYLKDLDFIHENLNVDHIIISAVEGVQLENLQQCHEAMRELVEHAHKLGLRILFIQQKVKEMWSAGYRCALVPDYAITDGRIQCKDGKISFNGHEFSHCLFLYPKYSKKAVYDFLNHAGASGLSIAAVGRADIDYNGEPAELTIPVYPEYDSSILEKMACPKRGIPEGCIYSDGSFALVSKAALLEHQPQPVDMVIEGVRYKGVNTGILAWRNGLQVASDGGFLEKVQ